MSDKAVILAFAEKQKRSLNKQAREILARLEHLAAHIDESGHLILSLPDVEPINAGKVVGDPGKDGEPGKDGDPGQPGLPGKDAAPVTADQIKAQVVPWLLDNITQPKDGKPGTPGKPGRAPTASEIAAAVDAWLADHIDLIKPAPAEPGKPGKPGKQGKPGPMGPMPKHRWRGSRLSFEKAPGIFGDEVDLRGPGAVGTGSTQKRLVFELEGKSHQWQKEELGINNPVVLAVLNPSGNEVSVVWSCSGGVLRIESLVPLDGHFAIVG